MEKFDIFFKFKSLELNGVVKGYKIIFLLIITFLIFYSLGIIERPIFNYSFHSQMISRNISGLMSTEKTIQKEGNEIENLAHMKHFFTSLKNIELKKRKKNINILYYGTSNIGFDRVTGQIRKNLQIKFGDGGKGFITISKGWKYHRHQDIKWKFSDNWKSFAVTYNKRDDGLYGLGGVVSINDGPAWVQYETIKNSSSFTPGTKFSKFIIYYRTLKNGGNLTLTINDTKKITIETRNEIEKDEIYVLNLKDSAQNIKIETDNKPVMLYGVSAERNTGVTLHGLMLVGAHVKALLNFNQSHIKNAIKEINSDLIIFQMGSNEAFLKHDKKSIDKFINEYSDGINRIRKTNPSSSCLLISIKDLGMTYKNKIVTRPGVPIIVDATKKVAEKTNCSFFDLFEYMGGEGTMGRWHKKTPKLVSNDYGHLFNPGATKVGNMIFDAIMNEYNKFSKDDEKND